jgi:hypothetical protein
MVITTKFYERTSYTKSRLYIYKVGIVTTINPPQEVLD